MHLAYEQVVPQFRSVGVRNRWVVASIAGEPRHADSAPTEPLPSHPPELVVDAQLQALQVIVATN